MLFLCWLVVSLILTRKTSICRWSKVNTWLTYGTVISPPIILGGSSGVNFGDEIYQYLVSTSLIVSGLLSAMQMARFHVYGTKYYVGTGLLSVVGTYIPITHSIQSTPQSI